MKQRIITGLIGGTGFLIFLWYGGIPYSVLIGLLALIAYYELLKMVKAKIYSLEGIIGLSTVLLIIIQSNFTFFWLDNINPVMIILFLMILYLTVPVIKKNKVSFANMGYILLGALYIGFGFSFMLTTRMLDQGLALTLLIMLATWASDSGAYFTGKIFGKHKLWPQISPNKTIEGALGGIFLAVLVSFLINLYINIYQNLFLVLLLGLIISVTGQLGDLVESALKRSNNVKDSGYILPGHGGILDRFDSLIFTFPFLYLVNIL